MLRFQRVCIGVRKSFIENHDAVPFVCAAALVGASLLLCASGAVAQNVTTEHYDNARTGLNPNESILNTSNVNTNSFGKIFSQSVDGQIYAQPLYMAGLTISGKGTHNVVFVATENDSVYAFDADNNGGANASPLWKISLLDAAHGAASGATTVPKRNVRSTDIKTKNGVNGTNVIDTNTKTI